MAGSAELELASAFVSGYTSRAELSSDEVAVLPELMRLRNVVSGVWWLGRHLATGTPELSAGRLEWVRSCNMFIGRSRQRLLGIKLLADRYDDRKSIEA